MYLTEDSAGISFSCMLGFTQPTQPTPLPHVNDDDDGDIGTSRLNFAFIRISDVQVVVQFESKNHCTMDCVCTILHW